MSNPRDTYWSIVWRQFRKNRAAYWAMWALWPLFLVSIFAPVLASDRPFVYYDRDQWLFPWFRDLFHTEEPSDFFYNMALVVFLPWAGAAWWLNRRWRRQGMNRPRRLLRILGLYAALTFAAVVLFAWTPLRPANLYFERQFVSEEFRDPQRWGVYAPIPFGPITIDDKSFYRPPMYKKPPTEWTRANDYFPHLLGTDGGGRDVLVRLIYGTRLATTVGFVAVGLYLTIGVVVGALAGYFGGKVDMLISRLIEVMLVFPAFFLILTLVGFLGQSIYIIMVVIGITGWPTIARLIRGEVLKQRNMEYVLAALSQGAGHARVLFRHVLPNALSPALVAAPFGIASAIIVEAGLSLLGFGVRPPAPSWGALLREAHGNYEYWWLIVFPSLAVFFTVTLFNLVGNGLRDAMDPRLRR